MIYFDENKVVIQSFKKILKVDDYEIIFIFNNKTITINGENLSIPFFETDEFIIKGNIIKIEISKWLDQYIYIE